MGWMDEREAPAPRAGHPASAQPVASQPVAPSIKAGMELLDAIFDRAEISIDEYHRLRDELERRAANAGVRHR